jgi:hypothetical protein
MAEEPSPHQRAGGGEETAERAEVRRHLGAEIVEAPALVGEKPLALFGVHPVRVVGASPNASRGGRPTPTAANSA